MTFTNLKKRVFSYINYVDSSGDPITGSDVTATDVGNWINDRYLDEIFPEYSRIKPEYFMQDGTWDNYTATGTVDAASTSTTLVTTSAIFTTDMIDAWVYNTTDGASAKIKSVTNTTTVTLDTTIGDDWDGDTIYVFTGKFTFGGDMTDCYRVEWVGVKYASTDTDFRRVRATNDRDVFERWRGRTQNDTFTQMDPVYMFKTIDVAGAMTSAIEIRPIDWEEAISDAIYVRYIERPAELSADGDTPRLPIAHHKLLVWGAVADAYTKIGNFDKAQFFEQKYNNEFRRLVRSHPAERDKRTLRTGAYTYRFISRAG